MPKNPDSRDLFPGALEMMILHMGCQDGARRLCPNPPAQLKCSILFAEPPESAYINGILKAIGSHNFVA